MTLPAAALPLIEIIAFAVGLKIALFLLLKALRPHAFKKADTQ